MENIGIEHFKQSQSHGLFWDDEIRVVVFDNPHCINDTTKYDISCGNNRFDKNENISIKTSGNDNIDCGDILRFYDLEPDVKLTIILIKYNQIGEQKKISEIIEIDYNEKLRNILFGTIPKSELVEYVDFVKSIKKGTVDNSIKKQYKDYKQRLQTTYNMVINISPKVDSKNQRRVQCSIPKINKLLEKYHEFVLYRSTEAVVRGIPITSVISSGRRKRNHNV